MSTDEPSIEQTAEPAPVMPLEYYDDSRESWRPMIRWMSFAAVVAGGLQLMTGVTQLLYLWISPGTMSSLRSAFSSRYFGMVGFFAWVAGIFAASGLLLSGGIFGLCRHRLTGNLVRAGAVAVVVVSLINLALTIFSYSSLPGGLPPGFRLVQMVSLSQSMLQQDFVPCLLWFFFRRPSVRSALVNR